MTLRALDGKARARVWALAALILVTLAFIWGNSLLSREQSQAESDFVARYVRPMLRALLGPFAEQGAIDAIDIRKMAHFVEFYVLGIELAMLRRALRAACRLPAWLPALLPLAVAGMDELLQHVSMRGPSLTDVAIDWAGGLTGVLGACAVQALIGRGRRSRKGETHA